ncbi:MAG: TerB family tellurite resistance protein [Pseudomonadota bacterium]
MKAFLQKLAEQLRPDAEDAPEPGSALALAATALLFEVAFADRTVAPAELAQIERALRGRFDLPEAELQTIITEAQAGYEDRVGVQSLTRTLTEHWEEPERFELVVAMWQVALAEDGIDAFEEHRIRAIADLLYLSHSRFIEAKLQARQRS